MKALKLASNAHHTLSY